MLTALGLVASISARPVAPATTHVVRLEAGRFNPGEVRVAVGDTVRFVNTLGVLHNVQFMADSLTPRAREALDAAMKDEIGPLASPMLITQGETYEIVVPELAPGRYPFLCSPHWASMRGALVVER